MALSQKKGYIAISTVLIVSIVVLAISASVAMLSINSAQSSFSLDKGEETLGFVEGCAEDGLAKSQATIGYMGGTITRPEGTCQISLSKDSTMWTMTVSTADTKYKKTLLVIFERTPTKITLVSWQEI